MLLRGGPARCVVTSTMPSLRELEADLPLLLIDAASSRIQVGVWEAAERPRWAASEDEAGVGIFSCIEELGVDLERIAAFAFCDGPGSVLGVRTAAMALRTWAMLKPRPLFGYCSLALVAQALGRPEVAVIADARRDAWHHFQIGRGLRRVSTTELGQRECVMPEHFRHWTPLPAHVTRLPYAVAELWPRVREFNLFLPTEAPDAFLHEEPSYATWLPKIHRAPGER